MVVAEIWRMPNGYFRVLLYPKDGRMPAFHASEHFWSEEAAKRAYPFRWKKPQPAGPAEVVAVAECEAAEAWSILQRLPEEKRRGRKA